MFFNFWFFIKSLSSSVPHASHDEYLKFLSPTTLAYIDVSDEANSDISEESP